MQFSAPHASLPGNASVKVDLDKALFVVSDKFLSITLDSNAMRDHWSTINLTCPRIINLAKGLLPATLRVGGTSQDFVFFSPDGSIEKSDYSPTKQTSQPLKDCPKKNQNSYTACMSKSQCYGGCRGDYVSNFTLSGADWDLVNGFVQKVGWELVFGLNVFLTKDWKLQTWDSSNAHELIQYTMKKGYTVLAWELGNGM